MGRKLTPVRLDVLLTFPAHDQGSAGPLQQGQKLFTYLRYNAEPTREGLDALGCHDIAPETVQKLDSIDGIPDLRRVGKSVAETKVLEGHFDGFIAS
jgi:hypothetical protein